MAALRCLRGSSVQLRRVLHCLRGNSVRQAFLVAAVVLLTSTGGNTAASPSIVFQSHEGLQEASHLNSSLPVDYSAPYFERTYPTGWFSSPVILNTHVESSQLLTLLTQRKRTHYPSFITAHCVEYPTAIVLFNVLWIPNSQNWRWTAVLNVDGTDLQTRLNELMAAGQKPKQIDSYAFRSHGTIYYSAVFIDQEKWPLKTSFSAAFGTPKDQTYCCGPSSRWSVLQNAGYKLLSLSVTQDPMTRNLYVADVWNNRNVTYWQAAMDKSPGQLVSILSALPPPLLPVYVKGYWYTYPSGAIQMFYSYIAEADDSLPSYATTVDVSRSGVELLAKTVKYPPIFVSSFFLEGEMDPQDPTTGDMYTAIWQGVPALALGSKGHKNVTNLRASV